MIKRKVGEGIIQSLYHYGEETLETSKKEPTVNRLIAVALLAVGFLIAGCEKWERPEDFLGPGGESGVRDTPITLSMVPGAKTILNDLYPDIPPDARVYGMGTLFWEWTGDFNSRVDLGITWSQIETLEIERMVEIGRQYTVSLWVDGRMVAELTRIRDEELTNFGLDISPRGYLWSYFSLGRDPQTEEVYVYQREDDRDKMVSIRFVYDGWSESIEDSCEHLNGPQAEQQYQAYLASNLSYDQTTPLYWQPGENSWAKWYRGFAQGTDDDYYVIITVPTQPPYRLFWPWGVYDGGTELVHQFRAAEEWYPFDFGLNTDGSVNQGNDTRCASVGGD